MIKNHAWTALGYMSGGLVLGMVVHAWFYQLETKNSPEGLVVEPRKERESLETNEIPVQRLDLSSSRQLLEAAFPGSRIGGMDEKAPLDPTAIQVKTIINNPVSSYQKVVTLLNLAKTLPPNRRKLAYAGAAFACGPQEFQQLMLPLIWDPATPADLVPVLAGGLIGLPDPVRLPICVSFLQHREESIRALGVSVLEAYFPETEEASYPAAVQAYLANPE